MKIRELTDSQLIARESKLRDALVLMDKWSSSYTRSYHVWFMLREAGLARGLFKFFVPSGNKQKGGEAL